MIKRRVGVAYIVPTAIDPYQNCFRRFGLALGTNVKVQAVFALRWVSCSVNRARIRGSAGQADVNSIGSDGTAEQPGEYEKA